MSVRYVVGGASLCGYLHLRNMGLLKHMPAWLAIPLLILLFSCGAKESTSSTTESTAEAITHSFLVAGPDFTGILDESGEIVWDAGQPAARDGYILPDGHALICWSDRVVEYDSNREIVFEFHKTDSSNELGTAVKLPNNRILITESGINPRLLEVNPQAQIEVEVPLKPETDNIHMQTRMARKLSNGNYLVPHLLAFAVKEYDPSGEVLQVFRTDLSELGGKEAENWPFTAIRLDNGNTVISLTHGNKVIEVDPDGEVVWKMGNEDVDQPLFQDPCGAQRLPNGNTVIASYGAQQGVKLFEVTPEKEVVWQYQGEYRVHHFQILTTNGVALASPPLK